ncbi:OmpA family protein [Shewanella sp. VB17]|uniref:MotY family protein n=1 Tax=Shewanella sp. VB17 TaxID=2739432 RepID=UPI001566C3EF|nr:OmpA family protein [Shewanella sp. VB17]NRD71711.1 OmpA family protein [Shewanella sp. VB17]
MKRSVRITICSLFIILINSELALAKVFHYQTEFEQAKWDYSGDRYQCKIEHKVSGFGQFKLIAEPGSPVKLQLIADWVTFNNKQSTLSVQAPSWKRDNHSNSTQTLLVWHDNMASSQKAINPFIEGLEQGASWQASIVATEGDTYLVETTPIATQAIAQKFKLCRHNLLPKPFSYVRRVDLPFNSGSSKLQLAHEADLEAIAQYVAVDNSIVKILVDAHADGSGKRLANLVMSQERADEVASRLIELGITKNMVEVRHHGDRSPKVSNNTHAGRQLNRRVTIRLIKSPITTPVSQQTGAPHESL